MLNFRFIGTCKTLEYQLEEDQFGLTQSLKAELLP
jgi:hypothetical protein